MKYRKKPVVIDAMRWTGEVGAAFGYVDVLGWLTSEMIPYRVNDMGDLIIPTLEGDMSAARGDWIIRGVAGEFYPCKPDIFDATYEPAAPQVAPEPERCPTCRSDDRMKRGWMVFDTPCWDHWHRPAPLVEGEQA